MERNGKEMGKESYRMKNAFCREWKELENLEKDGIEREDMVRNNKGWDFSWKSVKKL